MWSLMGIGGAVSKGLGMGHAPSDGEKEAHEGADIISSSAGKEQDGIKRDDWKLISNAAEKRLELAQAAVAEAVTKGDISTTEVSFLHPNTHHLVTECWKKFEKHIASKSMACKRVKLSDHQKKAFKVTRKSAYLVAVGMTAAACKKELKSTLAVSSHAPAARRKKSAAASAAAPTPTGTADVPAAATGAGPAPASAAGASSSSS